MFFPVVTPINWLMARRAQENPDTKQSPECDRAIPIKAKRCPELTSQLAAPLPDRGRLRRGQLTQPCRGPGTPAGHADEADYLSEKYRTSAMQISTSSASGASWARLRTRTSRYLSTVG